MNLFAIDFEPTTAVQVVGAATPADSSAVTKKISDGRIILEKNDTQYNAAGARLK